MKNKWFATIAVCFGLIGQASAWQNYFGNTQTQQQPTYGSTYDTKTGNQYRWNTNQYGETKVRGNNYQTGSMWNTTVKPSGDMNGFDSKGNYWNYNKGTRMYYNYGTGETRYKGKR